jgi:ATP-dependent helicase YprA (DUF1998 family)
MSQYLDPINAATKPRENLIRYLLTAYPLRDPHLRYGFKRLLEEVGNVYQLPYLEGAQPYKPASTIQKLVDEKILHPEITRMFNPTRPLYKHQEDAIRSVVQNQENIVVATGTGSGKTECFLIPMMDHLLKQPAPGMQTLILYPMNALVNDQVKRLRQLLCQQGDDGKLIRFGFYTSRTIKDRDEARESLKKELEASDREELLQLFSKEQKASLNLTRPEYLVKEALEQIERVQAISREEIWNNPPQILVTNYSMLEHMLIRPKERQKIFETAVNFKLLVVDEAHSYNGSTGTEVSMLLKRFRAAIGIEKEGTIRGIATSASLGDRSDPKVVDAVKDFAHDLFGEKFDQVIWGDRVTVAERLGDPYALPVGLSESDVYEYFCDLALPALTDNITQWRTQLSYLVPDDVLAKAEAASNKDVHKFLWLTLSRHPIMHRLIEILSKSPQPWDDVARSTELWEVPTLLDGTIAPEEVKKLETALSHLVQLGTLARQSEDELPLLPMRLHLLFRSMEGLYACVKKDCGGAESDPSCPDRPKRYGKLYLNTKAHCECCSSPVIELASCRKCGQAYGMTYLGNNGELLPLPRSVEAVEDNTAIHVLTSGSLDSVTNDEGDDDETDEQSIDNRVGTFTIQPRGTAGWIGSKSSTPPTASGNSDQWSLHWQIPPESKNQEGGHLKNCPACTAGRNQRAAIGRFVSYTDAPLEVMLDSLFELLPESEPDKNSAQSTKRKLLTFSDGRQDAAFFASDFQRTHTETLYRQLVWQAFQVVQENGITSINQVQDELVEQFLTCSIPHPDRDSEKHHRSYVANDPNEEKTSNSIDCKKAAQSRAKELLLREFGLPSARRFSIEALGLLACHFEWPDDFVQQVADQFSLNQAEARVFLVGLAHIMRLTGAVDLQGSSRYFPETFGVEGGRPGLLDNKGRSQVYLKLSREKDDKQATSFLWRKNKNGEPTKKQNQLVTYYSDFLGVCPSEEAISDLFDKLRNKGFLVNYNNGRQLNWGMFNLYQSETDWHQCNTCQQIFHIPGLTALKGKSQLGVDNCFAPRCKGRLQPFQLEHLPDHHYLHLIRDRQILPLRSQEHTAQLSPDELAKREGRFRQGKINLLSCSTTLEMGVDIGELQVVALRNFPPHVSNYQQRAGRAGRRTDGVAITLMYGQRRPHDRYYFEQPAKLINGKNQVPKLDPSNFEIQKRHIHAELLAEFLRTEINGTKDPIGAEKVTISSFLGLSDTLLPLPEIPSEAMALRFKEWLHHNRAEKSTQQWLKRLASDQTVEFVIQKFITELNQFQYDQLKDWNGLAKLFQELRQLVRSADDANHSKNQKRLEFRRDRIQDELKKVLKYQLHEELAKASILPIYGFPIDVVQLLTRDTKKDYKSSQEQSKHRLQRDRRLALGEYAPGQDVVVDDLVHTSVGVVSPDDLPSRHYWVCRSCSFFMSASTDNEILQRLGIDDGDIKCPTCRIKPSTLEQKPRLYKIPKKFTTDLGESPKVTPYNKPLRQTTSQVFLAQGGESSELSKHNDLYSLTLSQGGSFFLANQGGKGFKGHGFAICERCGLDQTGKVPANQSHYTSGKIKHTHPITSKECQGRYCRIHLGHEFRSDLLKLQFSPKASPPALLNSVLHLDAGGEIHSDAEENSNQISAPVGGLGFWRSLTYALLAAAAQVIDVPRAELDGLFRLREDSSTRETEIIIYDNVPGGAGYSKRIVECFPAILQRALEFVNSCSCDSSCYDCLRTYTNQAFHHELDRHSVANFLLPIVELDQPDEALKSFAPDANRISLTQMGVSVDSHCKRANSHSIGYSPSITDLFSLKQLTQIVDSLGLSAPLELIVTNLPDRTNDDHVRVLRKRLAQWIDLGLLRLYTTTAEQLPTICFSSQSEHHTALQLRYEDGKSIAPLAPKAIEYFQTRSKHGVGHVVEGLEALKAKATLVSVKALEDPDTVVIFPTPQWGNMSLAELQGQLGLDSVLKGNQVKKLVYCDRYLQESGAELLASLLQGDWLDAASQSVVRIQQLKEEYDCRDTHRKALIEGAMSHLPGKLTVEMRPYLSRSQPPFPHRRELTIWMQNSKIHRVLFDKGMDFLEQNTDGYYYVKEASYVVIASES